MYKIFIVEDELLIRQNIRNIIESIQGPYALTGEAADGEMALSMMQDIMPDILITDLKMPFLDGFGLIRHIKAIIPWLKIIIISGYDEFESAQKAISLGVDMYLLKPVRREELEAAISKVVLGLDENRHKNSAPGGYDEDELQYALRQHFVSQLLYGSVDTGYVLERARTLGLDVVHPLYQIAMFYFDVHDHKREEFRSAIFSVLHEQDARLFYFNGSDQLTVILCGDNKTALNEETYQFINITRYALSSLCVLTTVVGNIVERLSAIRDSCAAAGAMIKKVRNIASVEIIDINDTAQIAADIVSFSGVFDSSLYSKLQECAEDDIPALLETYFNGADSVKFNSVLYRYYALVDVLKMAVSLVCASKPGADSKDVAARLSGSHDIFLASERRDSFEKQAVQLLSEAVRLRREGSSQPRHSHVINRAKEYVAENFCDPNISLISTARFVGMSPAHFSTIFAQTTGTSFINYLTAMRLNRAKQLLTGSDMKLSAIAMDIGYNEPNYFSHVFKKVEGITPKEYRNKFL
ncbi:MAG: response regulator [Oscillospiraceae bacterium]|jgi:two-component system response regulator YesN|nr:response regulator [Oscillospiraceae bacterium]